MPMVLTQRAKIMLPVCLFALIGLSYWRLKPDEAARRELTLSGKTMGTTYEVVVVDTALEQQPLARALQAELDRLQGLMSTYESDSEVSRFNLRRSTEPMQVSEDTAQVVRAALDVSQASAGAFDVTVRPLVALWGFGAGAKKEPPSNADIQAIRDKVGYRLLSVQVDGTPRLQKQTPELQIDLSAIAKGYAVDQLTRLLTEHGAEHFMVEVGGELRVAGEKVSGRGWRIGVEKPTAGQRAVEQVIELRDVAMATSGDYRNFYERQGERISHTIDPRDGRPIAHALASVTVLHESTMRADAWATALNVLGPSAGLRLASERNLAALFIVRNDDGTFHSQQTPRFSELTEPAQSATTNAGHPASDP